MIQTHLANRARILSISICLAALSCQETRRASSPPPQPMSAASDANWSQAGLLKSEFIFETAPFPECHASTIVETESGLVAAWFGGTHERHPDVGIWLSRLVGGKWTAPVEVANGIDSASNRYP